MDFLDVIKHRRSTRAFSAQPVEDDKLRVILESINRAPSAGNLQAYEVYLVREQAAKTALAASALGQLFIAGAPVVLVFCAHPERAAAYGDRGRRLYAFQDATIACTFAALAATALGLASVWVGAFREEAARRAIGAGSGVTPVAILPVGYAAEAPRATPRRPLEELVHEVR